LLAAHPPAPFHRLALHQSDVRRRASEGRQAETQEEPADLTG
jgi:hypothetical protein